MKFQKRTLRDGVTAMLLTFPCIAAAEVCDKEVPSWDHTTGPVSEFDHLANVTFSPFGLILAGLLLCAMLLRKQWIPILGVAVTLVGVAWLISNYFDHSGIYAASIQEGCRASPVVTLSLLLALTILFVWRAVQLQNRRIKNKSYETGAQ